MLLDEFDAAAQCWDTVVRAVAHCGFLESATKLMLASGAHTHDSELLGYTRSVRGVHGTTLLMRAVARRDAARVAEILEACPTPAARQELLECVDSSGWSALHYAAFRDASGDEAAALRLVDLLLVHGASRQLSRPTRPSCLDPCRRFIRPCDLAARWSDAISAHILGGRTVPRVQPGPSDACLRLQRELMSSSD